MVVLLVQRNLLSQILIVLAMTRVQSKTAKKLAIFFFLVLTMFVVIELNIPAYDIYNLYASGIIQLKKSLVTSRVLYKFGDKSHKWYLCVSLYIGR